MGKPFPASRKATCHQHPNNVHFTQKSDGQNDEENIVTELVAYLSYCMLQWLPLCLASLLSVWLAVWMAGLLAGWLVF